MSAVTHLHPRTENAEKIFSRVLVGIDGSPEALEAARQSALLMAPGGTLALLTAWNLEPPLVAPMTVLPADDEDERAARSLAEDALRTAKEQLPSAQTKLLRGFPAHVLSDEIVRSESTLVAVGSHGQGRVTGIVVGSTATRLVHDAPCSVLVARGGNSWVPRRIAVGVDGSMHSAAAYVAASYIAHRFDAELNVVVAEGVESLDLAAVSLIAGDGFHVISEQPVAVLTAASADSDLLVLGSRGMHGFKSLGSVSERVAHRARCSTLIVRAS